MLGKRWLRALVALIVLAGIGLGSATSAPGAAGSGAGVIGGGLRGGIVATFDVGGERFRVWVTNRATIRQIYALQRGTSTANIPSGKILPGPGRARHNAPWHWHLDPNDISMADVTIEVCDATPSYVEAHRAEFIHNLGRYCAWGARLVGIRDYR